MERKWIPFGFRRLPIVNNEAVDLSVTIDESGADNPQLHSMITYAVPNTKSSGSQKNNSDALPFSLENFDPNINSSTISTPTAGSSATYHY